MGLEPAGLRWGLAHTMAPWCSQRRQRRPGPVWPPMASPGPLPPFFRWALPAAPVKACRGRPAHRQPWTPAWEAPLRPALDVCGPCLSCHVNIQPRVGRGQPGAEAWGPSLTSGVMGGARGPAGPCGSFSRVHHLRGPVSGSPSVLHISDCRVALRPPLPLSVGARGAQLGPALDAELAGLQ